MPFGDPTATHEDNLVWLSATWVQERIVVTPKPVLPEVVRIWGDHHLDCRELPFDVSPWEIREAVTIARIFAVRDTLQPAYPFVLSGESAVVYQGLYSWWSTPDIVYRSSVSRRRPLLFPQVRVGSVVVPQVRAQHLTGGVRVAANDCATHLGVAVAPPHGLIADLARTTHPLQAFVGACSVLRHTTNFDVHRPQASRLAEQSTRQHLQKKLAEAGEFRGCRLAEALVSSADAGAESPPEAALLWALHCLLSPSRSRRLRTQFEVVAANKKYRLDVSMPHLHTAIEPDGASKFGEDAETFSQKANQFVRRYRDLLDAGWFVYHIPAADLGDMDLLRVVRRAAVCAGFIRGDGSPTGSGRLWRTLNPDLFNKDRCH